jgi:hypothetical protein
LDRLLKPVVARGHWGNASTVDVNAATAMTAAEKVGSSIATYKSGLSFGKYDVVEVVDVRKDQG